MKVFAIIVTYNGIPWIERCLKSLLKTDIDLEVIVVDNASSDSTPQLIEEKFHAVRLLKQEKNLGFGRANNIGLSLALKENADYAFLLNQDAFVQPETLRNLVEVAEENKEYGVISPVHLDSEGTNLDKSFLYYIKNPGNNQFLSDFILNKEKKDIYDLKMINAAAWLLPSKTLKLVGGFHPMFFLYGEDDNYCQRVHYHGLKIGVTPNTFIIHDSKNNNHPEFEAGTQKYYDKFLNRIKIEYANINTENYLRLSGLRFFYLKQTVRSIIELNWKEAKINLERRRLIRPLDFRNDVIEGRKKKSNYLEL